MRFLFIKMGPSLSIMQISITVFQYDWNLFAQIRHDTCFVFTTGHEVIHLIMVHLIVYSYFSLVML